ncbi:RHO1 GDP-GTP exchange protein 2 [Massospora cicadina]|nr:RHO1 GDP-GTP exchange protein 2 [Massospora cicadina]
MAQDGKGSGLLGISEGTQEGQGHPIGCRPTKSRFLRDIQPRTDPNSEPTNKFATFNSRLKLYTKPQKFKKPLIIKPTSEVVDNSDNLVISPKDEGSRFNASKHDPLTLNRSITAGNRPFNTMRSISNLRSPEPVPNSPTEFLGRDAGGEVDPRPHLPTDTSSGPTLNQSLEANYKVPIKKLRNVRSEFFTNSTKTLTSMLPRMDRLNLFGKGSTLKGHPISPTITDGLPPLKASSNTGTTRNGSEPDPYTEVGPESPISPAMDKNMTSFPLGEASAEPSPVPVEDVGEGPVATPEPFVYGALLTEVSYQFYKLLANHGPFDGPKVFTGREAVDLIGTVLGTGDRGVALLAGRALEAQHFFIHAAQDLLIPATQALRLQDSLYETYKLDPQFETIDTLTEDAFHGALPVGVLTALTDCYSPTCSPETRCYSITCPRRLGGPSPAELAAEVSRSPQEAAKAEQRLWANFVAREIVSGVSERERKRQEIIFELIYTERDFVADLELIRELYLLPLLNSDVVGEGFVDQVFSNVLEVHAASARRSQSLHELQQRSPVVRGLGACLLENLGSFEPFRAYGANQVYSKRRLAETIKESPPLEEFLRNQARHPECRKLPLQSFLARPTTRLGRYPLLLEAILKHTEEGSSDAEHLPAVIEGIKGVLSEINVRAGIADNRVRIDDIRSHLVGPPEVLEELDLGSDARVLVREGVFKKKSGVEFVEIFVFLFDTHLLMAKKRKSPRNPENYELKVSKKPIQLDLLSLPDPEDHPLIKPIASAPIPIVALEAHRATSFPLTVCHLGRQGGTYTLYCTSLAEKLKWQAVIGDQLAKVLANRMVFQVQPLADRATCPVPGIYCTATYDSARTVLLGADDGIYIRAGGEPTFSLAFQLDRVKRLEVLEDCDLVLALSERTLYALPLGPIAKRSRDQGVAEKLKSGVDFFSVGSCLGRTLVCAVRTTALSTTGRLYQPYAARKSLGGPRAFLTALGPKRPLEFFKEFYIPSESFGVYFLKSKLCVACAKGFEVLDLASLRPQGLLNPADPHLGFVFSRGEAIKPVAFFRIREGRFFVCYDAFGFFVDRAGQLEAGAPVLHWKGGPKAFTLHYPYVLAFDPSFVEVCSLETGEVRQILRTNHTVTLRTGVEAIHLLDQAHLPDAWKLKELTLNRSHPTNVAFRKGLKEARTSKRRGMIGARPIPPYRPRIAPDPPRLNPGCIVVYKLETAFKLPLDARGLLRSHGGPTQPLRRQGLQVWLAWRPRLSTSPWGQRVKRHRPTLSAQAPAATSDHRNPNSILTPWAFK